MLSIVYIFLGVVAFPFVEGFVSGLFGLSTFFFVIALLYQKINWKILFAFILLSSLVIDVLCHYPLGFHILLGAVCLGLLQLVSLFIPLTRSLPKYCILFVIFVVYDILLKLFGPFVLTGYVGNVTWSSILGFSISSIFASAFVFVGDIIFERIRENSSSSTLKLRSVYGS